jgi:spermidine/putrescine transport system permease protein
MSGAASRIGLFLGATSLPVLFVLLPMGAFLLISFWTVQSSQIVRDFTLANYGEFFTGGTYLRVFGQTLQLCGAVALIGVLLGYPIAYFIWKRRSRARYVLLLLFMIPLFMSYIVKIYTMRSILGLDGFLNRGLLALGILERPSLLFLYNRLSILLTMAVIFLPFAILPIFLSLERIPRSLVQASADLGGSPGRTFLHVVLPLSAPGTIAGALFVFVLALGDFITPQMVGGPSGFTIGRVIWSQFGLAFNWPFGAAIAAVLLVLAVAAIMAAAAIAQRQRV